VELLDGQTSLGLWWVSNWLVEEALVGMVRQQAGASIRPLLNTTPQSFRFKDRTYQLALRPVRHYKPFSLQLLKFSHDKYPGTELPKNFSSRVRLLRPEAGEDREVLIYMNNPLRYAGQTFYQSGYDENDPRVTVLQVVRNPGWLTPYLGCLLVAAGMTFQFLLHLMGYLKQGRTE
jgi:cytochrome c biogenesis protein ResB